MYPTFALYRAIIPAFTGISGGVACGCHMLTWEPRNRLDFPHEAPNVPTGAHYGSGLWRILPVQYQRPAIGTGNGVRSTGPLGARAGVISRFRYAVGREKWLLALAERRCLCRKAYARIGGRSDTVRRMEHIKYWLALNRIPHLGAVRFRRLEAYFGELANAWSASAGELRAAGIEERVACEIAAARQQTSPDAEVEQLRKAGVEALNWHDPGYPSRLKEISDPPPVLYVKGNLLPSDELAVAVVGTRNATAYGREVASRLAADLAQQGITIVSGLARGIDYAAHRAALDSGGRTIAAVASGLDIVYPREHTGMFQSIQEHGAAISELPLGTRPDRRRFPRRNRLISGTSLGTLVVEAGESSGALITVKHALEQDREVFCVPGSILSPASRGTNRLIQEGAKLVLDFNDILEELNLSVVTQQMELQIPAPAGQTPETTIQIPPGEAEAGLLEYLEEEPLHIDDIRRRCRLPVASVSGLLTMLELKGLVKQVGGMHYVRTREATLTYGH